MGQSTAFTCTSCGYEAFVAGGTDCGFDAVVVTIACRDCRALHDASPDQDSRTFMAGEQDPSLLTGLACPKDPSHRWELWCAGDPCPKCGGAMEITGMGCCWD